MLNGGKVDVIGILFYNLIEIKPLLYIKIY